jgi:hypothetical protein
MQKGGMQFPSALLCFLIGFVALFFVIAVTAKLVESPINNIVIVDLAVAQRAGDRVGNEARRHRQLL